MTKNLNKKEYAIQIKNCEARSGTTVYISRSNKKILEFKCKTKNCLYFHRANVNSQVVTFKKAHGHTCEYFPPSNEEILKISMKPKSLKNSFSIQKLKNLIVESNPETNFDIVENNGMFKKCFISLKNWINIFKYSLNIVQIDGTFIKNKYKQILLAAVGIDGNANIFPIAISVVDCENEDNWNYFLKHLKEIFDKNLIDVTKIVIVSDREKGLVKSITNNFNLSTNYYCNRHLTANLKKRYKNLNDISLYYSCVYSKSKSLFEKNYKLLKISNVELFNELETIGIERWSIVNCPKKLYGYNDSNLVESFNSSIIKERKLPLIDCLDGIITKYAKIIYLRSKNINLISNFLSENIIKKLNIQGFVKNEFKISEVGNNVYYSQNNNGRFLININSKTCSCGDIQINGYPCIHFLGVIEELKLNKNDFVDKCFYKTTLIKAYSIEFSPYAFNNSIFENDILNSPKIKASRGRPKGKRIKTIMDFSKKNK